jgi:hypothetical protein
MSGKKDKKFYEEEDEDEEKEYEEEEEEEDEEKCPPSHHVSRSNPNEVRKKGDACLVYNEDEHEDTKCPPQQVSRSKVVNEERVDHKPRKHRTRTHKHQKRARKDRKHKHTKQPSKAHQEFAQKDEEAIAIEEGVLSQDWEKIEEATDGHVSGCDPNERGVSSEAGKAAHGLSGGRHAVSSLRGTDVRPGAEAVDSEARPPNNAQRHTYTFPPTRPGAQRVPGPGNEGLDEDEDEEQMTVVSREELIIPIVPEAERIDIEEEERRRQKEINEGIDDFIATAAVADVVPDNRGRRWKFVGAFLLVNMILTAVVIGAVLGTNGRDDETLSPEAPKDETLSPEIPKDYRGLISNVSFDEGEALENSSTPQYMAFNWTTTGNPHLANASDKQIIQRYALATIFFSTNGNSWRVKTGWLDGGEECTGWHGLNCTTSTTRHEVSALDLVGNKLQGTLPAEIGLLSTLGEFTVESKMTLRVFIFLHLLILIVCLDCLCSFSRSFV